VKVSKELIKMLKHHEGVRYKPYQCPGKLWTIGVGHVMYPEQAKIPSNIDGMAARKAYPLKQQDNRKWSEVEVDAILAKDVVRFERGVVRYLPIRLSQNEFDALVSFSLVYFSDQPSVKRCYVAIKRLPYKAYSSITKLVVRS
jgi:lysozyme